MVPFWVHEQKGPGRMQLEGGRCGLGGRPQGPAALIPLPCESHQRRCTEPSPCGQLATRGQVGEEPGQHCARSLVCLTLPFSTTSPDMPRRRWPTRTHAGEL